MSVLSKIKNAFKKVEKAVIAPAIKAINKTIIKPIENKVIKPAIKGIQQKIIKPVQKKISSDKLKKSANKKIKNVVNKITIAKAPEFQKLSINKPATNNDDLINIINNPTIPNSNVTQTVSKNNYNPNTITYLDNDIYYMDNKQKKFDVKKIKTNRYIKIFTIIVMVILGLTILIELSKDPKHKWNMLVLYLILLYLLVFCYDINKRYFFFNEINSLDKIFNNKYANKIRNKI